MVHKPLTVLKCIAKNMLMRMGVGLFLKDALSTSHGTVNWATRPVDEICDHVVAIYQELMSHAGMKDGDLNGKTVLEIGPGHNLGVALLFLLNGCRRAIAVESADTARPSEKLHTLYRRIAEAHRAGGGAVLGDAWWLDPARVGFYPNTAFESFHRIEDGSVDLIYSHRVLEHIRDLETCFRTMFRLLRPGGISMHVVDLAGHSEFAEPCGALDFLRYPQHLWHLMFSHRPSVNRVRAGAYRDLLRNAGFRLDKWAVLSRIGEGEAEAMRPHLAPEFAHLPAEELAVTGFFFLAKKP